MNGTCNFLQYQGTLCLDNYFSFLFGLPQGKCSLIFGNLACLVVCIFMHCSLLTICDILCTFNIALPVLVLFLNGSSYLSTQFSTSKCLFTQHCVLLVLQHSLAKDVVDIHQHDLNFSFHVMVHIFSLKMHFVQYGCIYYKVHPRLIILNGP
jgi:hypothetical protein